MKRKGKFLIAALIAVLCFGSVLAAGCGGDPPAPPPADNRPAVVKETENAFKDYSAADFASVDWSAKKSDVGIAYEFEGSYAEGFQTATELSYFDAELYKDGSVRAVYGSVYCGWWYNVDSYGDDCLIIKWVSNNGSPFAEESAATAYDQGDYEWQSSISIHVTANDRRVLLLYGREYKKAKSLEIDASEAKTEYNPGAKLDTQKLAITVVREDGSRVKVRDGKCQFEYDLSSSGPSTVKVKYDGAEGSYDVTVKGVSSIKLDTTQVAKSFKAGEKFDCVGLKVTAVYDDDNEEVLGVNDYTVDKADRILTGRGEQTVTVSYGSITATYEINVYGIKTVNVDASAAKTSYEVGENLNTAGLVIKAIYDNDDELDLTTEDVQFSRLVLDEVGENLDVFVTFQDVKGSYQITVTGTVYTGKTVYNGAQTDMTVTRLTDRSALVKVGDGEPFSAGFNVNDPFLLGGFRDRYYIILWGIEDEAYKDIPQVYALDKNSNTFSVIDTAGGAWHGTDKIWGNEWFTCQNYHLYILNDRDLLVAMEVDKGTGSGESEDKVVYFACGYKLDGDTLTLPLKLEEESDKGGFYDSTDSGGNYWFPYSYGSTGVSNSLEDGIVMWKHFTVTDDGAAVRRAKA